MYLSISISIFLTMLASPTDAQALGIACGCILGLFPLIFLDQKKKALKASFDEVDLSGDGVLDRREISMALHRFGLMISEHKVDELIEACDQNLDGVLSFDEFVDLVSKWEALNEASKEQLLLRKSSQ